MKILTFGILASALALGTIGTAANASEYRGQRTGGYYHKQDYKHRDDRAIKVRHRDHRHYGHKPMHRPRYTYRGHRHSAHWKWYKRHSHPHGHRRVVVIERHYHRGSAAPVVAGSIIGGAIASEVSGGDRGATAVGAVLGAIIAADASERRHQRVTVIRRHHR
jgi:hypothetical protein